MQDINKSKERRIIANIGDLFRGSSHLFYVPAFTVIKNFHYNKSRKITRCRNTYNELPQELLNPQVPHLFPQEQHATRKLVEAATSTTPPKYKVEHLAISSLDHQQILPQASML